MGLKSNYAAYADDAVIVYSRYSREVIESNIMGNILKNR